MSESQRERDIEAVARTIYGEARGESYEGKEAVGAVIQNRHFGDIPYLKGDTLTETVSKKNQFAGYSPTMDVDRGSAAWKDSLKIAGQVVDHKCPDPTGGMTHFDTINTPSTQRYAEGRKRGFFTGQLILGHHEFTREVKAGKPTSNSRHDSVSSDDDVLIVQKVAYVLPGVSQAEYRELTQPQSESETEHREPNQPQSESKLQVPESRKFQFYQPPPPLWNPPPEPRGRDIKPFVALGANGLVVGIQIAVRCALL